MLVLPPTENTTVSPSTSSSRRSNGLVFVVRWAITTALPFCPGQAEPGQWLGPRSMALSVTPCQIVCLKPSFGMAIVPTSATRSGAYGAAGTSIGVDGWAGRGKTGTAAGISLAGGGVGWG